MRYLTRKSIGLLAALVLWAGLNVAPANAGLLPVAVSVVPDGDHYRYTYGVVLTSDSTLHTGDYFTVYDFAGYIEGSAASPDGFSAGTARSGATPNHIFPVDDPTLPNLTWTYNGPEIAVGQLGLGNFSAISEYGSTTTGFFVSLTHRQVDGRPEGNVTDTDIPIPMGPPCDTPEPTTLVLSALALSCAGGFRWFRRTPK